MNFGELQDEVLAHGFSTQRYRTRAGQWLNIAQQRVVGLVDVPSLRRVHEFDTEAGTGSYQYAPPQTVIRVEGVIRKEDGYRLFPFEDVVATLGPVAQGAPVAYLIRDTLSQISLLPVPSMVTAIQVVGYARPPEMADNDDQPLIDARYHDLLVSFALQRAYRAEDDQQMAAFYQGEFERDLRIYAADLNYPQAEAPIITPGTWG